MTENRPRLERKVIARPERFSGRVAIVTGGGSGIGRSIARMLAAEGAAVVVVGRRAEPLRETVDLIAAAGGRSRSIRADVTDPLVVQTMVSETVEAFGRIDILVNNAGFQPGRAPVGEIDDALWDRTLRSNLTSQFLCAKYTLPALVVAKGNIVNILSFLGYRISPQYAAYASAKAGAEALTRSIALEYGPQGVRCNGVQPARVETEMNRAAIETHRQRGTYEQMLKAFPIRFMGDTDDVARAACFLASDEARWITGAILAVDGGVSA